MDYAEILKQLAGGGDPFAPSEQDRKDALTRALFTFGLGTLAAPYGGKGIGGGLNAAAKGGMMGMVAHQNALADATKGKQDKLAMRVQLAQLIRQAKEQERADKSREAYSRAVQAGRIPGGTVDVPMPGAPGENEGPQTAPMQTPGRFDLSRVVDTYSADPDADPAQVIALQQAAQKQQGWVKVGEAPGGGDLYRKPDGGLEVIGKGEDAWRPVKQDDQGVWMQNARNGDIKLIHNTAAKVTANAYGGAGGAVTKGLDEGTGKYVYGEGGPIAQLNAARSQNQVLRSMLPRVNTTGFFAPENKTFQQFLTSMGLGGEKAKLYAANTEAFQADAMALVLQAQAAQKGPQTDKDFMRIQESLPRLRNTPLGNEYIIRLRIAQNNRMAAQSEFMGRLMMDRQNPMNALEAQMAWERSPEAQRSLFDDHVLKGFSLDRQSRGGSITPAGSATVGGVTVTPVGR